MKILSLIAVVAALSLVAGETFAGDGLDNLKSEIQKRKEQLEKCDGLIRIPEILKGFCTGACPENLTQTSNYLSEFTSEFVGTRLFKRTERTSKSVPEPVIEQQSENQNCSICLDNIEQDETYFPLGCGHCYHLECIRPSLQSYLDQEQTDKLISCKEKGCCYKISPTELAQLAIGSDQALAIQRMFVRSVDVLKFCPGCGEGIAKHNPLLEFGYHCQRCDRDLCFSCGKPPHHDVTCEELNTDQGVKQAFIQEILKMSQGGSYGLCPSCGALIEKTDGCNSMICGQNAADKTQIPGAIQDRGCGHKFSWNSRIRLENAASRGRASAIALRLEERRLEERRLEERRLEEQRLEEQRLEERRLQAGIIRVETDDPRVRDFPEFVALGEMFQVGDLILSGVTLQYMRSEIGHGKAISFCRNLDARRKFFGRFRGGGARVPAVWEWRAIREVMGWRGDGYNPDLIPDMRNRFWSSSLSSHDFFDRRFWILIGPTGDLWGHSPYGNMAVRCVRSAE